MPKEKISLTNLLGVSLREGKPSVFLMELTLDHLEGFVAEENRVIWP